MEKTLGLYLHIPFCRSKCHYCDFCSFPHRDESAVERYCRALEDELTARGRELSGYTVDTIYFGGGTPTYLRPERLASLLEVAKSRFSVAKDAEISTECNPATVDKAGLATLKEAGFTRLSLGAQSMINEELKELGRIHTADDFKKTFAEAREVGFDNISVDLMFGIPNQTEGSFRRTLSELMALAPEHISAYGLKLEEGTPFYERRGNLRLPSEDEERTMYMGAVELLAAQGYARYEISNFAKKGKVSRHNLRYWERQDYLGVGLAAYSCLGYERFSNTEDMESYLRGERDGERERVSAHDALCEAIMLGMRLARGVDFEALAARYGEGARSYLSALLRYERGGFVRKTERGCAFTSEGMYVSNTILSDILDFEG